MYNDVIFVFRFRIQARNLPASILFSIYFLVFFSACKCFYLHTKWWCTHTHLLICIHNVYINTTKEKEIYKKRELQHRLRGAYSELLRTILQEALHSHMYLKSFHHMTRPPHKHRIHYNPYYGRIWMSLCVCVYGTRLNWCRAVQYKHKRTRRRSHILDKVSFINCAYEFVYFINYILLFYTFIAPYDRWMHMSAYLKNKKLVTRMKYMLCRYV